ncbi:MAG TPA: transcriptional regulator PpsR [Pseudomonadales bacterium]|nr:transcriptional regulator PpsR [Pseudomonadales bacterium]
MKKGFEFPSERLGKLDVDAAATLVTAAADIALIVDAEGVIVDLALGIEPPAVRNPRQWIGQKWIDTVTTESRPKIEEMLSAADDTPSRWRHINHPAAGDSDVPMQYCAFAAGTDGAVVVIGRDLQGVAALQQRLIETQQSLEQDYWRRRQVETRYRVLFQVASEAVLIADAASGKVLEANPAAEQLFDRLDGKLVGSRLTQCIGEADQPVVEQMLASLRGTGSVERLEVGLGGGGTSALLSASLLTQDGSLLYLLRLTPLGVESPAAAQVPRLRQNMLQVLENGPDGLVITDENGVVLTANRAFLELAELAAEEQTRDLTLDRWIGRTNVDVKVLIRNLRQYGSLRHFATRVRGEYGAETEIEISAVTVRDGDRYNFGFVMRDVARRQATPDVLPRTSPKTVQQLTELVGKVPLKEVIRESSDILERLCIEAALELTGDNRASAAELLGLSRQSLYVKLRRHGLMNSDANDDS